MQTDHYTKTVLTIIAGALVVLTGTQLIRPSSAQLGSDCGGIRNPCYIDTLTSLSVQVDNWPIRLR